MWLNASRATKPDGSYRAARPLVGKVLVAGQGVLILTTTHLAGSLVTFVAWPVPPVAAVDATATATSTAVTT